jgi:uncharacterized protein
MDGLEVRESPGKGRGVFASRPFRKGQVIARDPVLVVSPENRQALHDSELGDYFFMWTGAADGCVALGYGSLYNHSYAPAATYGRDYRNRTMVFTALRDIAAGEEITINYNGDPADDSPLWFDTRE